MNPAVEQFISEVGTIHETDYGDFMRKANVYLRDLMDYMSRLPYQDIHVKLQEMQNYLQYKPNWEVESTQKRVLQDAFLLDEMVSHHNSGYLH